MKALLSQIRSAVLATVVLAFVCCGLYPLAVWAIAQIAFPHKANGSLIVARDGTVRGSELLGQNFTAAKYFHPRPSAAGNGYDAANSSGSNLGPTSRKLNDAIMPFPPTPSPRPAAASIRTSVRATPSFKPRASRRHATSARIRFASLSNETPTPPTWEFSANRA